MWIWCLPINNCALCTEFMISYPYNVIQTTNITMNSQIIAVDVGSFETGYTVCFKDCEYGWFWIAHQELFVTDETPTWVELLEHPDPDRLMDCVYFLDDTIPWGQPYCVEVHTRFGINRHCPPEDPVGAGESTWSSIKSLCKTPHN
jgi:hypothetical protein